MDRSWTCRRANGRFWSCWSRGRARSWQKRRSCSRSPRWRISCPTTRSSNTSRAFVVGLQPLGLILRTVRGIGYLLEKPGDPSMRPLFASPQASALAAAGDRGRLACSRCSTPGARRCAPRKACRTGFLSARPWPLPNGSRVDEAGGLEVDIPYSSLEMLTSTAQDKVFYRVDGPVGTFLTGYAGSCGDRRPARRGGLCRRVLWPGRHPQCNPDARGIDGCGLDPVFRDGRRIHPCPIGAGAGDPAPVRAAAGGAGAWGGHPRLGRRDGRAAPAGAAWRGYRRAIAR